MKFRTMAIRSERDSHWLTHNYCKRRESVQDISGLDSFHFMEDESIEDFYVNSTPSEDIWKKFELIPTPPLSPTRDEPDGILVPCSTSDKLRLVSEKLDDPISYTVISDDYFQDVSDYFPTPVSPVVVPSSSPTTSSSSGLITDCMWSGHTPGKTDVQPKPKVTIRLEKADLSEYIADVNHGDDCVDPTSVFPFPISDGKLERSSFEARPETESEDSDEEIDVVTVDQMRSLFPKVVAPSRNPNSLLNQAILNSPTLISFDKFQTRPNKVITLKRKSWSLPASPEPKEKKLKRENSSPELTRMLSPAKKSTRVYRNNNIVTPDHSVRYPSDPEDFESHFESKEKRAQHNVLERKRRNDLKYSFYHLRDCIPALESHERAPKVIILQKAVDCIKKLHIEHRELLKSKDYETRRNEALKRRLELLESSYCY